jgi:hypothetical protein
MIINKKIFKHIKSITYAMECPKCHEETTDEVTGWCPVYAEPLINGECITGPDRQMCFAGCREDFSYGQDKLGKIFHCPNCEIFYNNNRKIIDWNSAIGLTDLDESDLKEYSDELVSRLDKYSREKTEECLGKKYYIEAIIGLYRQIMDQLRFLLIKNLKGKLNIPLDAENPRFKTLVPILERMDDSILIKFAFVFERLNEQEKSLLSELNAMRNAFAHSFMKSQREEYLSNNGKISSIIKHCQKIEERLSKLVNQYK